MRQIRSWQEAGEYRAKIPAEIEPALNSASAEVASLLAPAGAKATAVMLDRLFSVLPMGNADGLPVWIELLQDLPADVLRRAIDEVIRRHRWNTPPTIADVVAAADEDDEYQERKRTAYLIEYARREVELERAQDERRRAADDR
jgi:hypothetical protein